jgi:hypothetical protein
MVVLSLANGARAPAAILIATALIFSSELPGVATGDGCVGSGSQISGEQRQDAPPQAVSAPGDRASGMGKGPRCLNVTGEQLRRSVRLIARELRRPGSRACFSIAPFSNGAVKFAGIDFKMLAKRFVAVPICAHNSRLKILDRSQSRVSGAARPRAKRQHSRMDLCEPKTPINKLRLPAQSGS